MADDDLDDNFRDKLVAIGKGGAGLIPLIGGPLAEIIGVVVPGQRADRIVSYLRSVESRVNLMGLELQELLESVEKIDLLEEGGFQAARALSRERIEQIAEAVTQGLASADSELVRRKRLIRLLGELDDDEIALLNAYGRSYAGSDRNAFDSINRPSPIHLRSSNEERENDRLYKAGQAALLRLDLLEKKYGSVRRGETPEFDTSKGDFQHSVQISHLGRMLLKEIGLTTPFDQNRTEI